MEKKSVSRRQFLKQGAGFGLGFAGLGLLRPGDFLFGGIEPSVSGRLDLAIAKGGDAAGNTIKAIQALGGIEGFVKKHDKVVIKPNCLTYYPPRTASSTNPIVVETIVKMCLQAGAREVVVLSHDPLRCFEGNGIYKAALKAGAKVVAANDRKIYKTVTVMRGRLLQNTEIANDVLEADTIINVPIAKTHSYSGLTLSLKNLMGIIWDRSYFHHHGLHQTIADLSTVVKPHLIIMDANRILLSNGPQGPGQTRETKTVIAGTDPVAVDAYAATLFNRTAQQIKHIQYAYDLGIGEINLKKLKLREIKITRNKE